MRSELITDRHLARCAVIYVRQSSPHQVLTNQESLRLQYDLRQRALSLGWRDEDVEVIDADLGLSGAAATHREGFKDLIARVTLGQVGVVLSSEVTRLTRNCSDWYPLLDLCGYKDCLIADRDRPKGHRRERLSEAEQAELINPSTLSCAGLPPGTTGRYPISFDEASRLVRSTIPLLDRASLTSQRLALQASAAIAQRRPGCRPGPDQRGPRCPRCTCECSHRRRSFRPTPVGSCHELRIGPPRA
jgi:hypothetical protein